LAQVGILTGLLTPPPLPPPPPPPLALAPTTLLLLADMLACSSPLSITKKTKRANDLMKHIHMKLLDVEVRKTKLEKTKLNNNRSASDYLYDVFFGYRKSELQNMYRPCEEHILDQYTEFTTRENHLNVFW
jgi:hypothetical protein